MQDAHYVEERTEQLAWTVERSTGMTRRRLLGLAAAGLPVLAGIGRPTRALAATGPIVKPLPPEWFIPQGTNAEMRFEAMKGLGQVTPNERFFVRNHTSTPTIDLATWRLRVFGSGLRGDAPVELSYDDLLDLPARKVSASVECAGNGRSFFGSQQGTPVPGTQWRLGAIGVARWRGVPLADVLDRAGIRADAVDVMPQGLDATVISGGVDLGHVRRPLPVAKALDDALLAYEMNGEPLPPDHGFPLRLIVPGWVGIANVKWIGQIEVADRPLFSAWNTTQYRMTGGSYPPDSPPLTTQPVKSAFELPFGATFRAGVTQTLTGRSWSGLAPIRHVDVSTDGGRTWQAASLRAADDGDPWTRWDVRWRPQTAGPVQLLARATDRTGLTQPDTVPFNSLGYQFWAVARHPVEVI